MKIVIKGNPISKNRTKCMCMGNKPRVYDPQVDKEMKFVKNQILSEWNRFWDSSDRVTFLEASHLAKVESFKVGFTFAFPVVKSEALGPRNAKLWGFTPHNIKPDFDNLEKFYSDCATGILWNDDSQITIAYSKKIYSENPRTEIEIMENPPLKIDPKAQEILKVFGPSKMKAFLVDVHKFWNWNSGTISSLLLEDNSPAKEDSLMHLCCVLAEFSSKYADDLKKILKYKDLPSDMVKKQEFLNNLEMGKWSV